jgi:hypothetical protein
MWNRKLFSIPRTNYNISNSDAILSTTMIVGSYLIIMYISKNEQELALKSREYV